MNEEEDEEDEEDERGQEQEHNESDSLDNPLQPRVSDLATATNGSYGKEADGTFNGQDEQGQAGEKEEKVEEAHGPEEEEGEDEINQASQDNKESTTLPDEKGAAPQPEGKRHLSTRERRSMRKGKPIEPSADATETSSVAGGTASVSSKSLPPNKAKKSTPAPTRGKKSKEKKAAAKYADQDEEDRELALRVLGANNAKTQKAAAEVAKKADRAREAELQKQRRRAQHDRAVEAERKRQAAFEQGVGEEQDEESAVSEAADLSWLPALIGNPLPEDEILAAIPVCAPFAALNRYKYRVKLLPGTVKKGKAVKEIIGRWIAETTTGKAKKDYAEEASISLAAAERLSEREGELMKGWKDTEIINSVPVGGVRISSGSAATAGGKGGGGGGKGKSKGSGGGGGKGGKKK